MGHPCPVMTCVHLSFFVGADLLHCDMVRRLLLHGDVRRHSADGVGVATVAGLYREVDVCAQERLVHGDLGPVWKDELGLVAEFLDETEDVVPSPAVQSRRVLPELVKYLV